MNDLNNDSNEVAVNSSKRRFLIMIGSSIVISIALTVLSMFIYINSGASQIDLSRPGYKSVSSQANSGDDNVKDYSSTGTIDQASIDDFQALFAEQAEKAKAANAFSGDPLNLTSLGLTEAETTSETTSTSN